MAEASGRVKTFLVDLHDMQDELRPVLPFLYPYLAGGEMEMLPASGQPHSARGMAESVRVSVVRDYRPRLQLVFLIDLARESVVEQVGQLRREFVETLTAHGLPPSRVVVVGLDTVAREQHTGIPGDPAARALWAHDANTLASLGDVVLEGTVVLRFPLQRTLPAVFQQQLLELVYLVAVLVELFQADEQIAPEHLYLVDQVALDAAEVREWLAEYEACLAQTREAVEHQLAHPQPVEVALIENANCGCSNVLKPPVLAAKPYGWLWHTDDSRAWRRWWQDTGAVLEREAREGEGLVRRCLKEWRARKFERTERTVDAITELVSELGEQLEQARRALARPTRIREQNVDWEAEMQRMTPRVRSLIESRPRPRAFAISTAALLLLLVPPMLMTLPPAEASRTLPAVLLVLGGGALVTWGVLGLLRGRLHDETHQALERAQEISKDIVEHVNHRKEHLAALCTVEVARRNAAEGQDAQNRAGRVMRLLRFHRKELADHRRLVETFARNAPARAVPTPPAWEADEVRRVAPGWDVELPPPWNPAYAPALCTGLPKEQSYEVRVRGGARVIRRNSSRLRALQRLQLVDDIIYNRSANGPAESGGPTG